MLRPPCGRRCEDCSKCRIGEPWFARLKVAGQDEPAKNTTFDAQVQQLSLLPLYLFRGKYNIGILSPPLP